MIETQSLSEGLFRTFTAMFGAQAMGAMFADCDMADVYALWDSALASVRPQAIKAGIAALPRRSPERLGWPPKLDEFLGLCRDSYRPESNVPKLAPPVKRGPISDAEREVLTQMSKGPAVDPMYWAKAPKSVKAVELLVRGAEHDDRLRELLLMHMENDGERCRDVYAAEYIRHLANHPPQWMRQH